MRRLLLAQPPLLGRDDRAVARGLALVLVLAAAQERRDQLAQAEDCSADRQHGRDPLGAVREARRLAEVRPPAVRAVLPARALLDAAPRAAPQRRLVRGGEDRMDVVARAPARGLPLLVVE